MKRVVFAQARASGAAAGGPPCPLAVGWVRAGATPAHGALILKATLQLEAHGSFAQAKLAEVPDEMALGVPSELGGAREDELSYPSDFVLHKPACDVLLVGHAHGPEPTGRMEARLRLGSLDRRFAVVAAHPAAAIPLSAVHLRTPDGEPAEPVGPRGPAPALPEHFDFETFDFSTLQAACSAQRLETLPPDGIIELEGLSLDGSRREIQLPSLAPRAWLEAGIWGDDELELRCDTLWIDTDFERLVLVWRANFGLVHPDGREIRRVVVSLEQAEAQREHDEVLRELATGSVGRVVEEADLRGAAQEPDQGTVEADVARYEAMEHAAEPTLTLEQYARISAELAEQDVPREHVLDRHDFDEDGWTVEERGWLERMGEAAMGGDGSLAVEYGERFVAAQDELGGPEEPRSLDEYAAIKIALEHTYDPAKTMSEQPIRLAEWMRLDRHWSREAGADGAVREQLAGLLATERQRYEADGPAGGGDEQEGLA